MKSAGGAAWPRTLAVVGVLLVVAVLTAAAAAWLERDRFPASAVAIESAAFRAASPAAPWREVSLPHDWREERVPGRIAHYHATVAIADPVADLALHLHQVVGAVALRWNGARLADPERLSATGTRLASRPLLFEIPASHVRPGENRIEIRLEAPLESEGLLGRVSIGPEGPLARTHARRFAVDVILPQVIVLALVAVSAAVGVLWAYRREEREYGWLSLFLLAWAVHVAGLFAAPRAIPFEAWRWLGTVALGWAAVLIGLFVLRHLGEQRPKLERAVVGGASAASVGLGVVAALDAASVHLVVAAVWMPAVAALLFVLLGRILAELRRRGGRELELLAVASVALLAGVVRDALVLAGVLSRAQGATSHVAAPLVIAVAGWIIASRFARALGESESMAATLEDRVREKERDLERSSERLAELERAQMLGIERERIQREMHDGIGGRLVSALAVLDGAPGEAGSACALLRRAIGDLRLVSDVVDSEPRDAAAVLGALRERLESTLRASGLRLEWRVDDVPTASPLGPAQSLHLTRIVEEAIANVIRHSGARTVVVRTSSDASGAALLEIADDGGGIAPGAASGRGLPNMRRRAEEIGARLEIASSVRGSTLRLSLPTATSPEPGMQQPLEAD